MGVQILEWSCSNKDLSQYVADGFFLIGNVSTKVIGQDTSLLSVHYMI